jgi:hypothetical protein
VSAPSPYRVVLRWEDGRTRIVELRTAHTLRGAKVCARHYAADVGERGSLTLERNVGLVLRPQWAQCCVSQVKNGEGGKWK